MSHRGKLVRLTSFVVTMTLVLAALVVVFGQVRFDSTSTHRALFTSASGLRSGEFVRVAGVEVGSVGAVDVVDNDHAVVEFDVTDAYTVTESTTATIRYQNLVGDRYLELADTAGDAAPLAAGATIPVDRTSPALDLDRLLGGFQPLFSGLDPSTVNRVTGELVDVFQGQGGTVASVLARLASLTSSLADRDEVIGQLITNLRTTLATLAGRQDEVSLAIDSAQTLVSGLAADTRTWGEALTSIDSSAATIGDLLVDARPPLDTTVDQLQRTAAQLDAGKDTIASITTRLPDTYASLSRLGAYGNFFNYYLCGIRLKIDTPDGQGLTTPLIGQNTGRCAPA
ncbi:MCE family protein [Rhodococcus sp. BP-316]|nr:MCE family protein [Rhodococcus sp. BP-316]